MKMSFVFLRKIAPTLTALIITSNMIFGQTFTTNSCAAEQIMQIACHECHENFYADVSQSHAKCPHCGHSNEFSG